MEFEVIISRLEAELSNFVSLEKSVDNILNSIYITELNRQELNQYKSDIDILLKNLSDGYSKCSNWLSDYISDLKETELSLSNLTGKTVETPKEFQREFIDLFGRKVIGSLKTGSGDFISVAERLRLESGLTESDSWFFEELNYVNAMIDKANKYYGANVHGTMFHGDYQLSTDNDWFIMVDTDYCRIMYFKNEDGQWKPVGGQDCSVGCRGIEGIQRSSESAVMKDWGTKGAVRSFTFKGVHQVEHKHQPYDGNGMKGRLCYIPNGDDCQIIHNMCGRPDPSDAILPTDETWNNDVNYLQSRFTSLGCVCVRDETAKWNWDNIPEGTNVVIFDRWNLEPGIDGPGIDVDPGNAQDMPAMPQY